MGTVRGVMGTCRRPNAVPSSAPQVLPWTRATATTFSSPWVQNVCRGDKGTPPWQSQPSPELPAAGQPAPWPWLNPECSSRLGGQWSLWGWHTATHQDRAGGQGLPVAGTHNNTQMGTLATSMAASTSSGREAAGAARGPGLPVTPQVPITDRVPTFPSAPHPRPQDRDRWQGVNQPPSRPP